MKQAGLLARRFWNSLPVVVRAIVLAELIMEVGGLLPQIFLVANLKLSPRIPWLLPATALWLWLFWRYLDGAGWPRATATSRRRDLRAGSLSVRVWLWALFAGGLGMVSVATFAFVTARLANLPRDAFKLSFDLTPYPIWTIAAILIAISITAGVLEEAAFRGYLISLVERRHGWIVAILLSGLMFYVAHLSHAYVTLAFLPFFLAVSALHGLLVYLTRSILPSVVLHAVADMVVIPIQFGAIGHLSVTPIWQSGIDAEFVAYLVIVITFGLLAVPAFLHLAGVTKPGRLEADAAGTISA